MRLIDADALIANKFKNDISYNAFVRLVQRQPTVDGTAKWIVDADGQYMRCSHCEWYFEVYGGEEEEYLYCPHCGTKMG